jgi:hypothetical protein
MLMATPTLNVLIVAEDLQSPALLERLSTMVKSGQGSARVAFGGQPVNS